MRYIWLTVMPCFDLTPSQNQPLPIPKLSMNSKLKKNKLKFWLSQREICFGLQNFIIQAQPNLSILQSKYDTTVNAKFCLLFLIYS